MATARKKAIKSVQESEAIDVEHTVESEDSYTPDDVAVLGMLSELGDENAMVRIYRQGKGGYRDLTLIAEVGIAEFTPIMLSHAPYNGGTFRIHARSKSGIVMNREIKVEPSPVQAVAASAQAGTMTPEAIALAVATALKQIMPVPAPAQSRMDMLAEMKLMSELFRPAPPATPPGPDSMSMFNAALNAVSKVKEIAGEDEPRNTSGNDLLMGLVKEFLPMFKDAMANNPALMQRVAEMGGAASPAPQAPALPQQTTPQTEEPDVNIIQNQKLKFGLNFLCMQAEANNDAGTYAGMIIDNVPSDDLKVMLESPDWIERLARFEPQVRKYAEWFEEVRLEIIELMKPDDEEPPLTDPTEIKDPLPAP